MTISLRIPTKCRDGARRGFTRVEGIRYNSHTKGAKFRLFSLKIEKKNLNGYWFVLNLRKGICRVFL